MNFPFPMLHIIIPLSFIASTISVEKGSKTRSQPMVKLPHRTCYAMDTVMNQSFVRTKCAGQDRAALKCVCTISISMFQVLRAIIIIYFLLSKYIFCALQIKYI